MVCTSPLPTLNARKVPAAAVAVQRRWRRGWRMRRRARARSRGAARRPRTPAEPRRARSPSGRARRHRRTGCSAASPARRRCGTAGRRRCRRSPAPRLRRDAPARASWRRRRCADRAATSSSMSSGVSSRAVGVERVEAAGVEVGDRARGRACARRAAPEVRALAVDDHRAREHEPRRCRAAAIAASRVGGAEIVRRDVVGCIGEVDAEADLRGLVAHGVDAVRAPRRRRRRRARRPRTNSTPRVGIGGAAVHVGAQRVEHAHVATRASSARVDDRARR